MELRFCDGCMRRIEQEDFSTGRAAEADGRFYCPRCLRTKIGPAGSRAPAAPGVPAGPAGRRLTPGSGMPARPLTPGQATPLHRGPTPAGGTAAPMRRTPGRGQPPSPPRTPGQGAAPLRNVQPAPRRPATPAGGVKNPPTTKVAPRKASSAEDRGIPAAPPPAKPEGTAASPASSGWGGTIAVGLIVFALAGAGGYLAMAAMHGGDRTEAAPPGASLPVAPAVPPPSEPGPEPEPRPEPKPGPEAKPDPRPQPRPGPEPGPEPKPAPSPEPGPEPKPAPEPEAQDVPAPDVAGELSLTGVTAGTVELAWKGRTVEGVSFVIERKESDGRWGYYHGLNADGVFRDSGVKAAKTYFYRVRAQKNGKDLGTSNQVEARTPSVVESPQPKPVPTPAPEPQPEPKPEPKPEPEPGPEPKPEPGPKPEPKPSTGAPAAPSELRAEQKSATEIALAWKDNADNETGFEIERCVGLVDTLVVQLKAYSGANQAPVVAPMGAGFVAGAPQHVEGVGVGQWKTVPQALLGKPRLVTSFRDHGPANEKTRYVVAVSGPCTVYVPTKDKNKPGWLGGGWSDSGLTATNIKNEEFKLWKRDVAAAGDLTLPCDPDKTNSAAVSYVFAGRGEKRWAFAASADVNSTGKYDAVRAPGQKCWYRVRATNLAGKSEWSNEAEVAPPAAAPAPRN